MSWWWPFRRHRLEPLKDETRQHDHDIIALDQALHHEKEATRATHLRLHKAVVRVGDQFALTTQQLAHRIVDGGR